MRTMEEQIKKLKELADEYARFAGRTPIERHVQIQYGKEYYEKIILYFTKQREYNIKFERIEIIEYTDMIKIPVNYKAKDLERIYNDAKRFLDQKKEEIKEKTKKEKEKEIEELKRKLEEMEKENNN